MSRLKAETLFTLGGMACRHEQFRPAPPWDSLSMTRPPVKSTSVNTHTGLAAATARLAGRCPLPFAPEATA